MPLGSHPLDFIEVCCIVENKHDSIWPLVERNEHDDILFLNVVHCWAPVFGKHTFSVDELRSVLPDVAVGLLESVR